MSALDAGVETISRDAILERIDELAAPLGYGPGEFLDAAEAGSVPDTPEASAVLVLVPLIAR